MKKFKSPSDAETEAESALSVDSIGFEESEQAVKVRKLSLFKKRISIAPRKYLSLSGLSLFLQRNSNDPASFMVIYHKPVL